MSEEKKVRVIITVPPRPEFGNAYYSLQRRFESGAHVLDVTEAQLAELKLEPVINVVTQAELDAQAAAMEPVKPPEKQPEGDKPPEDKGPGKPMKR
jgi:hypothetical protein